MNPARKMLAMLATAAILAGWGCGGVEKPAVSGSTEETTVKGTVVIGGKPATRGQVFFDPSNINRPTVVGSRAPIGKDGTFSGKTLVGENMVSLEGLDQPSYRELFVVKPGGDTISIKVEPEPKEVPAEQ